MARLHAMYLDVERQDGWQDMMARVQKMRQDFVNELAVGTVDKFGNVRDNEKRAVLAVLHRILVFPQLVHQNFEDLDKKKREQEEKLERKTGIHGKDRLNIPMGAGREV